MHLAVRSINPKTIKLLLESGANAIYKNPAGKTPLTLALELAPLGQRVRLENNGAPVEIIRTKDQVIARSLLCTHQGCRVRWYEDQQLYICPCHEGKFDAEGEVVYGMPSSPLRRLTATIKNDQIVVSG